MEELKIDLSGILGQVGEELEADFLSDVLRRRDILDFLAAPLKIKMKFINTGDCILTQGKVTVPWNFNCSRCGRSFIREISVPLREEFYRKKPAGLPETERSFVIVADKYADLTEMLRQNIILATPDKPICSPQCPPVKYSTGGGAAGTVLAEKIKEARKKKSA